MKVEIGSERKSYYTRSRWIKRDKLMRETERVGKRERIGKRERGKRERVGKREKERLAGWECIMSPAQRTSHTRGDKMLVNKTLSSPCPPQHVSQTFPLRGCSQALGAKIGKATDSSKLMPGTDRKNK